MIARGVPPRGSHGQGVLTHRDGDPQRGAQLHTHRPHRGVEVRVLARLAAGCHPIRGQANIGEAVNVRRENIGDRFSHGQSSGGGRIQHRRRRPFAHGHGFAAIAVVAIQGHGDVGDGHLPGSHHLVAADHSADAAIADGDQERLIGNRRQTEQTIQRLADGRSGSRESRCGFVPGSHIAGHARRFAQQYLDRHIDRRGGRQWIGDEQAAFAGDLAHHGVWAPLAFAQSREQRHASRNQGHYIALLGFVAPDLHRRQFGLGTRDLAQVDAPAAPTVRNRLGQRVRQPACADVMNQQNRIRIPHGPAAVDDFLCAALHFGVAALHRGEIQIGRALPAADG